MAPPPEHGAHSTTRYPLAVSPSAKRSRALSAATPAVQAATATNSNSLSTAPAPFFPTLSDVPRALDVHTLTSFDFPATLSPVQPASSARASPAALPPTRARRQSQKPYAAQSAGLGAGTVSAAPPGPDGANQLEAKVVIRACTLVSRALGRYGVLGRPAGHARPPPASRR